jgi:hypothetical protein
LKLRKNHEIGFYKLGQKLGDNLVPKLSQLFLSDAKYENYSVFLEAVGGTKYDNETENRILSFHDGAIGGFFSNYWEDQFKLFYSYGQDLRNKEIKKKLKIIL